MMDRHELLRLTDDLAHIVATSGENSRRFGHIHFIVNAIAGGVARRRWFDASRAAVRRWVAGLQAPRSSQVGLTRSVHLTERPGHASQIAAGILDTPGVPGRSGRLIVSIGGDGTHREVFTALAERLDDRVGTLDSDFCMFRMPMGTGNDGADAADVEGACFVLQHGAPTSTVGLVRVTPAGMQPMYAFNVTSIGIDAFVTDMSNKLKSAFPGDMYKLIADVSTLFYEPIFKVEEVGLLLTDDTGCESEHHDRFILVAVGPTGNRHYGNGKRILPNEHNLCAIRTDNVFRKIAIKKHLYAGTHVGLPGTLSARVSRAVVNYGRRVPLQLDGEGVWLEPRNFPVTFERVDCAIPVLQSATPVQPKS